jgi:adenine-specific DNA-methyltransferase
MTDYKKMKFETPDRNAENIEKLNELFPNLISEGKVNLDALRAFVGEEVFTDECYDFTWAGKREAVLEAGKPTHKTLRPCVADSVDWDTTENLYIEGDNLEVLKLL